MSEPFNNLLSGYIPPDRRRRIANALMADQFNRPTPQDGPITERAGMFPLGTYANGQTGIAWPGFIAQPVESFVNLLRNGYQGGTGDTQGVEDAFNVAGGAMTGGLFASRPRGSLGVGGRSDLRPSSRSLAEPRTISALAEDTMTAAIQPSTRQTAESTLRAYHGSPHVFEQFDEGITPWFSTEKRTADRFAVDRASGNIYPNQISSWRMRNKDKVHVYEAEIAGKIKDVDVWSEASNMAKKANIAQPESWQDVANILQWADWQKDALTKARKDGFDAVRFMNVADDPAGEASDHIAVINNDAIRKLTQLYSGGGMVGNTVYALNNLLGQSGHGQNGLHWSSAMKPGDL